MPNRDQSDMPPRRKKKPPAKPGELRRHQFNVGLMPAVAARVERTAERLGIDPTQLLRMIVHEHLPEYEARAANAAGGSQS